MPLLNSIILLNSSNLIFFLISDRFLISINSDISGPEKYKGKLARPIEISKDYSSPKCAREKAHLGGFYSLL